MKVRSQNRRKSHRVATAESTKAPIPRHYVATYEQMALDSACSEGGPLRYDGGSSVWTPGAENSQVDKTSAKGWAEKGGDP